MSKSHAPSKSRPSTKPWRWTASVFGVGALIGLIVFGLQTALASMESYVRRGGETSLQRSAVVWTGQPDWLTQDLLAQCSPALAGATIDLSSPTLVPTLADALGRSPWVRSCKITKSKRRLELVTDCRRPVLCAPIDGQGCYLADDGMILSGADVKPEVLRECLVIEGLKLDEPLTVGSTPTDPRTQLAVKLAEYLRPHKNALDLLVLRLPDGGSNVCSLITQRNDLHYFWGASDAGGPLDQQRLERLRRFHEHWQQHRKPGVHRVDLMIEPLFPRPIADSQ